VTRSGAYTVSGSQTSGTGEDDVHFHRHTSETRELYGQMFSELGIPKIRSLSVGPTLPTLRISHPQQTDSSLSGRPVSPVSRGFDSSILSPPHQSKGISARPVSPATSQIATSSFSGSAALPHHGLQGQCILTVDMFSKEQLNAIFNLAQTFRLCVQKERSLDHILKVISLHKSTYIIGCVLHILGLVGQDYGLGFLRGQHSN
jgi:hypothetical protein